MIKALNIIGTATSGSNTATGFTDDSSIAAWARSSIVAAVNAGVLKGFPDGSFGPLKDATRAECCQMIWNVIGSKT